MRTRTSVEAREVPTLAEVIEGQLGQRTVTTVIKQRLVANDKRPSHANV